MNPAANSRGTQSDLDPILVGLVDEFSRRVENGEAVDVEAFAGLHPDHAERLRTLLPAIRGLAALGRSEAAAGAFSGDLGQGSQLGDFRILREVGRGGMGVVYEAFQASLNRTVALKVLSRSGGTHFLERFRREAQVVARLHHPHIVTVFGIGEDQGVHFFAMQFIQGHNLDKLLRSLRCEESAATDPTVPPTGRSTDAGANSAQEASGAGAVRWVDLRAPGSLSYYRAIAALGVHAAQGLAYAHSLGVLHRDIKPSNLLLDSSGIVLLTDFGLAKVEGDESLTNAGDVVGTLRYMAPERFDGRCDARSDVYGLGMTLYELLTQRPAFDETERAQLLDRIRNGAPAPPRSLRPDLPRDLETIVLKAIDPIPGTRYQTAGTLADDLQCYLENRPITARPPWWWDRVHKWARRRPGIAALAATLALTVGTLLIVWMVYSINLRTALGEKDHALGEKDQELGEKQKQWEKTEKARAEAESGQYRALRGETQALRLAGQAGWRLHALENLKQLSHSNAPEKNVFELRTEAVACLTATSDMHLDRSFQVDDTLSMAFSPDGGKLAVMSATGKVILWDLQTLRPLDSIASDFGNRSQNACSVVQFHPSGRYFVFADLDGVRVVTPERKQWTSFPDWTCRRR